MRGTIPTFYRIKITRNLIYAVQVGAYPAEETVVYAHEPKVPSARRYAEGMKPLENRRTIMSCYEGFKRFF